MKTIEEAPKNFAEFWPYYLREHSRPWTRRLHVLGTSLSLALVVAFVIAGFWRALFLALVVGYGFAWISHFAIERNRPATFRYPLWSLRADFKLWFLTVTGELPE